ncbi:hypothetical protein HDU96_002988 [Phlyctochytrium bullatum]|nr:hypothetical protein HDU96_002988 [Phlyctochytrium bullatum]
MQPLLLQHHQSPQHPFTHRHHAHSFPTGCRAHHPALPNFNPAIANLQALLDPFFLAQLQLSSIDIMSPDEAILPKASEMQDAMPIALSLLGSISVDGMASVAIPSTAAAASRKSSVSSRSSPADGPTPTSLATSTSTQPAPTDDAAGPAPKRRRLSKPPATGIAKIACTFCSRRKIRCFIHPDLLAAAAVDGPVLPRLACTSCKDRGKRCSFEGDDEEALPQPPNPPVHVLAMAARKPQRNASTPSTSSASTIVADIPAARGTKVPRKLRRASVPAAATVPEPIDNHPSPGLPPITRTLLTLLGLPTATPPPAALLPVLRLYAHPADADADHSWHTAADALMVTLLVVDPSEALPHLQAAVVLLAFPILKGRGTTLRWKEERVFAAALACARLARVNEEGRGESEEEDEMRRRVWWSLYVLDILMSLDSPSHPVIPSTESHNLRVPRSATATHPAPFFHTLLAALDNASSPASPAWTSHTPPLIAAALLSRASLLAAALWSPDTAFPDPTHPALRSLAAVTAAATRETAAVGGPGARLATAMFRAAMVRAHSPAWAVDWLFCNDVDPSSVLHADTAGPAGVLRVWAASPHAGVCARNAAEMVEEVAGVEGEVWRAVARTEVVYAVRVATVVEGLRGGGVWREEMGRVVVECGAGEEWEAVGRVRRGLFGMSGVGAAERDGCAR